MAQFIPTPEDVRDRVRYAATVADALLSTFAKRDGDTIRTTGRVTAGVGGADYTYHLTGRSAVTTDLGFYIAGSGADDYLELQDKTIVRMEQFGLIDDVYASDQSTLMKNAWDTAARYGGLLIKCKAGKFRGTVMADYPADVFPSIQGVAAHTYFKAANENDFALTCLRGKRYTVETGDVNTSTDTITLAGHELVDGTALQWLDIYTNTLPAPFAVNTNYYVVNAAENTIQLSASSGGAPVNITSVGSGATSELIWRGSSQFKIPAVKDITFYGGDLPGYVRDRHGLQINFGDVFHTERCWFYNCAIGLCNNATWGLYAQGNSYRNNYVGELLTTRNNANPITVQSNVVTLTQPYELWTDIDPEGQSQGPTVSTHIACDYTSNEVAIIYEIQNARYAVSYESNWFGGTIQGVTGIWIRASTYWGKTNPPMSFYNLHWESHADRTSDIDGETIPTHDIIQEAGVVQIYGPSNIKRITQTGGAIYAKDFWHPMELEQSGGAHISCDRLLGNGGEATADIYSNILEPNNYAPFEGDSGLASRIPDRLPVYQDASTKIGTLVAGFDGYNANRGSYGGRVGFVYNGSTLSYVAGESTFGEFSRFTTTGSGNQGCVYVADPVLTVGTAFKPWFMSVRIKADKAAVVYSAFAGSNRSLTVSTEWQTFGLIGIPDVDLGYLYLYVTDDTVQLDIDCVQVVVFDTEYEREAFQRSRHYLVSNALPLRGKETANLGDPAASEYVISQVPNGDVHVRVTDSTGYTKQGSILAGCTWGLQDENLLTRLNGDGDEDGSDDAMDWSYANLDAAWTGTPAYVAGPTGASSNAFSFDGTNWLQVDRVIEVADDFTISFWWKAATIASSQSVLDCFGAGSSGFLIVAQAEGGLRFYDGTTASNLCGFGTVGEWVHVVVSNINGTLQGYVDGEPYGPAWNPTMVAAVAKLRVGINVYGGQQLSGSIYDLRVYSRGFTSREINSELTCVAPSYAKRATPTLITTSGTLTENRTLELNGHTLALNDTDTGTGITVNPSGPALGIASGGDISLSPTGNVQFGSHSAIGAETVTGYIEIKDSGGTVRKIAVVS
jgi:hypothetical protein